MGWDTTHVLPISTRWRAWSGTTSGARCPIVLRNSSSCRASALTPPAQWRASHTRSRCKGRRSEEHTSELQSRLHLVCRLLLEKKKKKKKQQTTYNTSKRQQLSSN